MSGLSEKASNEETIPMCTPSQMIRQPSWVKFMDHVNSIDSHIASVQVILVLKKKKQLDKLGIEPNTSRMLISAKRA